MFGIFKNAVVSTNSPFLLTFPNTVSFRADLANFGMRGMDHEESSRCFEQDFEVDRVLLGSGKIWEEETFLAKWGAGGLRCNFSCCSQVFILTPR